MSGKHVDHGAIVDQSRRLLERQRSYPAPPLIIDGRVKVAPLPIGATATEYASSARLAKHNATRQLFDTLDAAEAWVAAGGTFTYEHGDHVDDERGVIVHRATVRITRLPAFDAIGEAPAPVSAIKHVGRTALEAEYRGLGIDPALIDIIEGADTLAERTARAKATGYRMRGGKAWAPCVVEPTYETGIESPLEPEVDQRSARNWRSWLGGRA